MRVLVVDDHPLMREILPAVLRRALQEVDVVTANDLESAFSALHARAPQLAVLDLGLPGCSGVEALTRFRRKFAKVPMVVVSAVDDAASIRAALDAGAAGYIPKTSSTDVMIAAFKLVAAGGTYVPPQAMEASSRTRASSTPELTERQREVLRLVVKGFSNDRIAEELSISRNTVKQHVHAIYSAYGVASRIELYAANARRR